MIDTNLYPLPTHHDDVCNGMGLDNGANSHLDETTGLHYHTGDGWCDRWDGPYLIDSNDNGLTHRNGGGESVVQPIDPLAWLADI